jgi:co-chaperonin GroES (HSP10)
MVRGMEEQPEREFDYTDAEGATRRELQPAGDVFDDASLVDERPETFRPAADWIVVQADPLPEVVGGGKIIMPGRQGVSVWRKFDWTAYGTVLAVGPGARDAATGQRIPIDEPKVGDRVIWEYRPSNDKEAINRLCGERTILLRAGEISAIIESE